MASQEGLSSEVLVSLAGLLVKKLSISALFLTYYIDISNTIQIYRVTDTVFIS
jgi:hypothetical protein